MGLKFCNEKVLLLFKSLLDLQTGYLSSLKSVHAVRKLHLFRNGNKNALI